MILLDSYMAVPEVARHFGVHRSMVHYWMQRGFLAFKKIEHSRIRLIHKKDVEKFVPPRQRPRGKRRTL